MATQNKRIELKKRLWIVLVCAVLFMMLCGMLAACGGTSAPDVPAQDIYHPMLALFICGDNTLSYPQKYLTEAMQNLADKINSSVVPNSGGMFVGVNLIEASSLQDTFVTFSTPAIPDIGSKPQPGNNQFSYAKDLQNWKKKAAKVSSLINSVQDSIKPSLDKMRGIHLQEVGGTDIPGCADTAAGVFSHYPNADKVLLYISDMQNNVDTQFSKHINLHAKVRVIYRVCEVQSACEQNDAFWAKQFKSWNAQSYEVFDPALSSAEKITFSY